MNATGKHRPRAALVGVCGYASRHLGLLSEFKDRLDLVACVVIERDQGLPEVDTLRRNGVKSYAQFEEMVAANAGRIDVCIIPTGIHWHARMSIAALRAGMNVLVEKPLAGCVEDAEAVRACEQQTGRWVCVGFQDMFSPAAIEFKEWIRSGIIGRLQCARMIGLAPRSSEYYIRNHWAGRLTADGAITNDSPLNNAFAHLTNLTLFFSGESVAEAARANVCKAELYRAHAIESFDTATVSAFTATGTKIWLGVSHACANNHQPLIQLDGDQGSALWSRGRFYKVSPRGQPDIEFPLKNDDDVCRDMYLAILDKLGGGSSFTCDTRIALCHTRLIEQIHLAARVETVASALIERRPSQSLQAGESVAIRGLEDVMMRAYGNASSLQEEGFNS